VKGYVLHKFDECRAEKNYKGVVWAFHIFIQITSKVKLVRVSQTLNLFQHLNEKRFSRKWKAWWIFTTLIWNICLF